MIVGEEKPSLDELSHFGVKGMKWGVRKGVTPPNSSYTPRMRQLDEKQHGPRAVERINTNMNQGLTRQQALHKEDVRNAYQRLAVIGAVVAANIVAEHGSTQISRLSTNIGEKANANRAAAKVADATIKIGSKAAKTPYVKPRRGVHNITTMK